MLKTTIVVIEKITFSWSDCVAVPFLEYRAILFEKGKAEHSQQMNVLIRPSANLGYERNPELLLVSIQNLK